MDRANGLGDLLTVKALAPKAPAPWSSDSQPRSAFSLPSAATGTRPPRSRSKEAISKSKGFSCDASPARPPLPSLQSLPRRILPGRFISSLEYTSSEVEHEPGPPIEGAFPVGPATSAWGNEAGSAEGTASVPSQGGRRDTTISLPGDAFSFAEAVDSPEDGLSESASDGDFIEEVVVEEFECDDAVEGDDEEEDENPAETEAEDNVDEGDDPDAKDSESDQPGSTEEDVAGCEDEATEAEAVEELLMIDGTEPVIIKKKKRKKKRKKKQKVTSIEEVTVEKKPPVPRFPHPSQSKEDVSCVGAAVDRSLSSGPERIPLRERFAKHLLFGRFPKRRPSGVATEEEKSGPEDGTVAPDEEVTDQAASLRRTRVPVSSAAARAARARERALRPPRVVRIKRILKEPKRALDVREESEKAAETDGEAKGSPGPSSLGLVARAIRLRREPPPPKTVWKEPVVETLLSLGSLYFSFSSMRTAEGKKVPLKNRDKVVRTLHELNTKVALPICRQFGLRYNFFSEHHPQAKKAGVTCKEPLILRKQGPDGTEIQETRHLVTIRLRLRLHPTKGDPQTDFISHGTQIAVLLHELCHLKHMNHGKDFMLFLRDIFAFAHKTLGVFDAGETNEIPSPWPWENVIFQRAGDVSNDELLRLFAEHREKQHQAKTPEPEPSHEPSEESPEAAVEPLEVPRKEVPDAVPDAVPDREEVLPDVPEDIEAVSTSASDDAKSPFRREDRHGLAKTKGASLNLVAAFRTKGHTTSCDCCDGRTEMAAYGEEETVETPMNDWLSGDDAPPPPAAPPVRLPPLTAFAFRGSPATVHASPRPRRLPPLA